MLGPGEARRFVRALTNAMEPIFDERPKIGIRWMHPDLGEVVVRPGSRDSIRCVALPDGMGTLKLGGAEELPLESIQALCIAAQAVMKSEAELELTRRSLDESYGAFAALRRIAADRELLLHPRAAIQAVLEQASSVESGMKSALWLERADQRVPAEWIGCEEPPLRHVEDGIVGRTIQDAQLHIENEWSKSPLDDGSEPELRGAARVACAPLIASRGVLGALVVWHDEPGEFEPHFGHLLDALAAQVAIIVDHNHLHTAALHYAEVDRDLRLAADIQKRLLLAQAPTPPAGVTLATMTRASKTVGGDFFDFFPHPSGPMDVLLGDVMGKGLPAALVAAAVKSRFLRIAATDGLAVMDPEELPDVAVIVDRVHHALCEELVELERFVTGVYARIDVRRAKAFFVDCGHVPILHYSRTMGRTVSWRREWKRLINLPFGMHRDTEYRAVEVNLDPGDLLLFYTDGLTEAADESGHLFGEDALAELLSRHADEEPLEIARHLQDEVLRFSRARGVGDDMTCIVLKFDGIPDDELQRALQESLDASQTLEEELDSALVGAGPELFLPHGPRDEARSDPQPEAKPDSDPQ